MRYSIVLLFLCVFSGLNAQVEFEINGQVVDLSIVTQVDLVDDRIDIFVHNLSNDSVNWHFGQCLLVDDPNIDQGALVWESHSTFFGICIDPIIITYPCWDLTAGAGAALVYPGDSAQLRLHFEVYADGCEMYRYKIIQNGVYTDSIDLNICRNTASINELNNDQALIYPNPSSEKVTVSSSIETAHFYNAQGRLVKEVQLESTSKEVSLWDLADGVYVVKLIDATGDSYVQRLVLEK